MGYSNKSDVDLIIAQAATSGRPSFSTNELTQIIGLGGIGTIRDTNRIPDEIVEMYISTSDQEIDGVLSQIYYTPFEKCAYGQWYLDEDINIPQVAGSSGDSAGNLDTITTTTNQIAVNSSTNLIEGDEILIRDDLSGQSTYAIVQTIIDQYTFTTVDNIEGTYYADGDARVIRISFPPPIPQISARLAASYIYDKYYAAQVQPSITDYGKQQRKMAHDQLNDCLNGRVTIRCARRRGDIAGNPYLDDVVHMRDRGFSTSERNKSNSS